MTSDTYFGVIRWIFLSIISVQPAFTCSKSTIETLEHGVKYVHY